MDSIFIQFPSLLYYVNGLRILTLLRPKNHFGQFNDQYENIFHQKRFIITNGQFGTWDDGTTLFIMSNLNKNFSATSPT